MKHNLVRFRSARFASESGIALPEVLTAAIVIVLILTANAYGLLSAYAAYGTAESSSKAYQIINTQFAYFKQASWQKLGTVALDPGSKLAQLGSNDPSPTAPGQGCAVPTTPYSGEDFSYVPRANSYKGENNDGSVEMPFQYCQAVQYQSQAKPVLLYSANGNAKTASDGTVAAGLGTTYYYQTVITNVSTNTFDKPNDGSASQSVQTDNTTYYNPKRITVTVTWRENDSAGNAKTQRVSMSTVRTPTLGECVPSGVRSANGSAIAAQRCGVG